MKTIITIAFVLISSVFFLTNISHAEELIHYSDNGSIIKRLQCNEIAIHDSSHQSTLVCTKTPRAALNIQFVRLRGDSEYRSCRQNRNCVVIDNTNDPAWRPIALYGVPDATFGQNIQGNSCVRIHETKPRGTSWAKDSWKLCTNNPNVELAYTYANGHKEGVVATRFKRKGAKKICFDEVLGRYQYRQFWVDNCLFVRQK